VFNGYPDVAPETRERVLAAIRAHDFAPVHAARSLVTGRTNVIGVVLETGIGHPDLEHPFFQEVLVGLKRTVGGEGFDILLFTVRAGGNASDAAGVPRGSQRYLARARQHQVDGLVVMGADPHDPEVEELVASGIPTMAVDLDLRGGRTGHVTSDNVGGASRVVEHLVELGHRRIALIGGPSNTRPGIERLLGYRRGLDRTGLEYLPELVREGDFYPESGYEAMVALLDLPDPPTAIFAAADLMAAGAMRATAERGISCPRDLSVVGFDDIQLAALLHPPLTTIRQDKQGLGRAAGEALVRMIADPELEPPIAVVPVELVARDSSYVVSGRPSRMEGKEVVG
jgi:LacI family transcriptional regulator